MTFAWYERDVSLQVLRAEVDVAGYDLVVSDGDVLRHIQFKAGKNGPVPISLRLCDAPSGCVVWARLRQPSAGWRPEVDYRFLGAAPGQPLLSESLGDKVTLRPRTKTRREGHRNINWTDLIGPLDPAALYTHLFGPHE